MTDVAIPIKRRTYSNIKIELTSFRRSIVLFSLAAAFGILYLGCATGHRPPAVEASAPVVIDSIGIRQSRLAARIDSLLGDTLLSQAQYGIYIVDAESGREIYQRGHQRLLVPASANKLFVTALALLKLGPQHRFVTQARGDSLERDGRLKGDLFLVGGGDPLLSNSDLETLAFRLKVSGLRKVSGRLILDNSLFDTASYGRGWMWDEGPYAYNAPISALSVNRNIFEVGITAAHRPAARTKVEIDPNSDYFVVENQSLTAFPGVRRNIRVNRSSAAGRESVMVSGVLPSEDSPLYLWRSVSHPLFYSGHLFRRSLRQRGIGIGDGMAEGRAGGGTAILAEVKSQPLYLILREMDKDSDNFIAEMLFRYLSANGRQPGDTAAGNVWEALMSSLGFAPGSYRIVDGSGMSRYNLCSPEQLTAVLRHLYGKPEIRPELLALLPVAATDGTLQNRLGAFPGRVRAKTGTMTGISSLAGFAFGDRAYVFAMIFNNYTAAASAARRLQDRIVESLLEIQP